MTSSFHAWVLSWCLAAACGGETAISPIGETSTEDVKTEVAPDVDVPQLDAIDSSVQDAIDREDCADRIPSVTCGLLPDAPWTDCTSNSVAPICDERCGECHASITSQCQDGWCFIPAGSWLSGSKSWQTDTNLPRFPAIVSRPFEIGETEVTIQDWLGVMGGDTPSTFDCGPTCPVTHATFFDATEYANRKSLNAGLNPCYVLTNCSVDDAGFGMECESITSFAPDCDGYRLPSEFEWELAANGGQPTCIADFAIDPTFDPNQNHPPDYGCAAFADVSVPGWYCGNSSVAYAGCKDLSGRNGPSCAGPHEVKAQGPNQFGLYDVHGNVEEMTETRFTWPVAVPSPVPYPTEPQVDPGFATIVVEDFQGTSSGLDNAIVSRGGSFANAIVGICAATRMPTSVGRPFNGLSFTGFRLVRTLLPEPVTE